MLPRVDATGLYRYLIVLALLSLTGCATSKVVGQDIQRISEGHAIAPTELHQALTTDGHDVTNGMQQFSHKFEAALAQLRSNVRQHWGQHDTRLADRTVYVKYTHGYQSRVITDFDHGSLTVETLDQKDPQGSLQTAIVAALLTSSDPNTVDLFSDKDVALDPNRKPYLYGLVHDSQGKPIRTREQAEQYARYLVQQKMQVRTVTADQGGQNAQFVRVAMVKNFEAKGAERYRASVEKYAAQYRVSPSLVLAIIRTESNFNPFAVSGASAYGLMQLVPSSGGRAAYKRVVGVDQVPTPDYLFDPEHNIELGVAYLSLLNDDEFHAIANPNSRDYCVIAAYNTGPHNVTRTFASDKIQALNDINSLEPAALYEQLRTNLPAEETRQYVVRVTDFRRQFVGAETPTAMNSVR